MNSSWEVLLITLQEIELCILGAKDINIKILVTLELALTLCSRNFKVTFKLSKKL